MAVVNKMTRRLFALTAAYAIALQATLAGFAFLAASAQAAPQMCAAVGHDSPAGSMPMGADCAACPAVCGPAAPDAVAPGEFTLAPPVVVSFALDRRIGPVAPWPAERLRPPSRAPPAA
jgi:hypothetical protein